MKFKSPWIPSNLVFVRHLSRKVLVLVSCLIIIVSFSKTAHASLASLVSSLLGSESASAKVVQPPSVGSSQTIALLQAAVNPDPNPQKSVDIVPVYGGTLVPDLATANADSSGTSANTQVSIYVVQPGDTLSGIGKMFGVSVNTILWANDITKASGIKPGQTLIILPVSGINYTVKKGDSILGIAQKYKADVDEILQYNDLTLSSTLTVGQTIILPDVEISTPLPTRIVVKPSVGGPDLAGYYTRPVKGGVRTQGIHGYNGVDLAAPVGTPIYAAASGTVIISLGGGGWNGGYGNFIVIYHPNGTQTLYAHNSKNLVKNGQYVQQGDMIALMGATGKATGSHVHFEVRGAKNPF